MGQINTNNYPTVSSLADADLLIVENATHGTGTTTPKQLRENAIGTDPLQTTAQTVTGAINELKNSGGLPENPLSTAHGGTGNAYGFIRTGQKSGTTIGANATAEGYQTTASAYAAHAEGANTTASNDSAHSEGEHTLASSTASHAEGSHSTASGVGAHSEGSAYIDFDSGNYVGNTASGEGAHAEGIGTSASGTASHSEGYGTSASGNYSHASGGSTTAGYAYQTVVGKINDNKSSTLFEVGNGTGANAKSNAFEVYSDGKISQDNGSTKFKFGNNGASDGYYDASDTFHAFGSGSGNTTSKTRYTISSSNWSANPDSGGYYTYALTLNPTIGSSPDVYIAGSGDDYQPTNNQKNMFAHVSRCMVNGTTLTLYALEKPTSNFYVWVEGIEGTTSTDIVGNVIQPNLSNAVTSRTRYTVNYSSWSASANADGYYTQQISMYPSVESNLEIYLAGSTDATQPTSTERNMFAYLERCKVNSVYLTLYAKTKPTSTFYIWAGGVNGESNTDVVGNIIQPNGEKSISISDMDSPTIHQDRLINVIGGYKVVGKKCYVNIFAKLNVTLTLISTFPSVAGIYDVIRGVPVPTQKAETLLSCCFLVKNNNIRYMIRSNGGGNATAYYEVTSQTGYIRISSYETIDITQEDVYVRIFGEYDIE